LRVVTKLADGAPLAALFVAVAPIGPDISAPVKLISVRDEETLCESVAVTVTFVNGFGASALQISEVPLCPFALATNVQANPPPEIPVTVVLAPVK
jgi:hypothetical protein